MIRACAVMCLRKTMALTVLQLFLAAIPLHALAQEMTIADVPRKQFSGQFHRDLGMLKSYSENMLKTLQVMEDSRLLKKGRAHDFDISEKASLNLLWGNCLDHIVAIDSIIGRYRTFSLVADRTNREDAFLIAYTSLVIKYANSLRIIRQTIGNELYEKTLDDMNAEYGIPAGMFARLKWNTIHVQDMTGILAGYQYCQFLDRSYAKRGIRDKVETAWMFDAIQRNYDFIAGEMKLSGPHYFAKNGLDIVKEMSFKAWFPMQMHVSEWMGDTKVKRIDRALITSAQLEIMKKHLQPGDVIVERRNWYLSNVGLPGFWPHAELFVGTYDDMKDFFSDPKVVNYYQQQGGYSDFMDYLGKKHPEQIKEFRHAAPDGHPHRIIEAVSEGVKFSSLEEGALADYIGVMRPRLSRLDIAKAIDEAFRYLGNPYDFNFDFLTDSSLVCSELIYKIYKNGQEKKGLGLSLRDIAGRKAMPANDIIVKFDHEYDGPDRELEFVYFLDGSEKDKRAVSKGLSDLRASHRRMKWDVVQH